MRSVLIAVVASVLSGCFPGREGPVQEPESAIEQIKNDPVTNIRILEEALDALVCADATEPGQGRVRRCESKTGITLTLFNAETRCTISSDPTRFVQPEWSSAGRCIGNLIWREDDGIPVAVVYRVSQFDDDPDSLARNYYRGRWIITTVAQPDQESCVTHDIGGIGSREVVLRELHKLVLPYACSDRFTLIDVN